MKTIVQPAGAVRELSDGTLHRLWVAVLLLVPFSHGSAYADGNLLSRDVEVAPIDEITIIDPGTNRELKPEVIVNERRVEIPPTIIVHKYYYSGDRDFRGPMFPGGPSIVVVQHPDTGEQLYLDVQMLPGSPRVVYRRHSIEYHFGKQAIQILFCNLLDPLHPKHPVVKYLDCCDDLRKPTRILPTGAAVHDWLDRTGIPSAAKSVTEGTKSLANSGADGIRRASQAVTAPMQQLVDSTALSRVLRRSPEDDAAAARDSGVARAQAEADRRSASIPTLR